MRIENTNNDEIVLDTIEAVIGYSKPNKLFKEDEKEHIQLF